MNKLFYVILIFLAHSFTLVSSQNNTTEFSGYGSWIRLCGSGKEYLGAEKADKCSSGFWFKDPVHVGCVCGHGVWIFAKGWCDKTAKIVIAYNGSCFSVDKDVRYMRNIGYSHDAYLPYHFQTTVGFEFVQELPTGFSFSYFSPSYDQHLGAIFPARDIESQNSKRCLEHDDPSNANRTLAMKYYADKLPYKQVDQCYKVRGSGENIFKYDEGHTLGDFFTLREKGQPGGPWMGNIIKDGKEHEKCNTECVKNGTNTTTIVFNRTAIISPDYVDPLDEEYVKYEHDHINKTKKQQKCDPNAKKYSLTNKTIREIKEQTKRMILANLGNSLKGISTPKVEVKDYVYFQIARQVLLKVCPNEEVPHALVTGLLRMFRVAVKESLRFYPFTEKGDDNQTQRIISSLQTCLNTARPFYFEYNPNATAPNNTDPKNPNSTADLCPNQLENVTYNYANEENRTLYTDIPCELETDLSQLDLPVETAWKTVMFTHYYCARHFMLNTTDYSGFYDKMEMFFNSWIQHRWYYPGPSLKAYEYIFMSFDLKRYAQNLDRCIAASRSFSNNRLWIKRPMYIKSCGGSVFQELEKPQPGEKPKLDPIAPKLTEFEEKAYCLPYWHSPVSNPGINYDAKEANGPGCVAYNKLEWEDDMTPDTRFSWLNSI